MTHPLPFFATLAFTLAAGMAAPPQPYGALPNENQLEWHELEQYAFCHFTINTFTDKEWGYGDEDPKLFNPTDLDVDQIVTSAKAAGLKSFMFTCKHHDGFCLWPTKTTGHNVSKSPWKDGKGDLVKDFSEACKRHGLKFGVYLSPWDRNNKDYGTPAYIDTFRAQLSELLTNYGDIYEVWFDGANGGDGFYGGARETRKIDRLTYYDWPTTWALVKKLQPKAVIMSDIGPQVRWIGNEHGKAHYPCWATSTPQGLNGNPPGPGEADCKLSQTGTVDGKFWIPGECDVSIRPGWFYHSNQDRKVKTPKQLLDLYFESVGHGASFLLNLPPDRRGQLHGEDVASLEKYGKIITSLYSENFADGATASADITREGGEYAAANVLDGDRYSYWATPDDAESGTLTLELSGARTFDVIRLREPIQLGQRIRSFAIDVRSDGEWKEWISDGSSVGAQVLFRKAPVTADAVRVRILGSAACPLLSEISLWKLPAEIPDELIGNGDENALDSTSWKATAAMDSKEHPAAHAIDGDPATYWSTDDGTARKQEVPQSLTIDFGKTETMGGVEVLPRQDGSAHAVVDRYRIEWSGDNKNWSPPLEGEFSNIRANPIAQTIPLEKPVTARFLRFTALHVLEKDNVTVAEIRVLK